MSQQNPLAGLQAYLAAANRHDLGTLMALFAEGAVFAVQGQFTLEGKDQIRAIHDYDAGINTRLEIYEPQERGDTIIFRMVEHNDWLKAAGLPPASYLRVEIEFREGLIQRIIATPSAESAGDLARVLGAFHHWAIQAHPQAYKALFTSDGQFNYNRETGVRVVALLRQWRISGRKSD